MKKLLFSICLLLLSSLLLIGCSDECTAHVDVDGNGACDVCNTALQAHEEKEEISFIKNGTPNFNIVISSEIISADVRYQINMLAADVNYFTDGDVMVTDESGDEIANEIIFGTVTTRGDEYAFDGHDWGEEGWAIKVIGSKIVVVGGSDGAMLNAIAALNKNVFGLTAETQSLDDVTVTEDMAQEWTPHKYTVTSIYIGETDIHDMVISYINGIKFSMDVAITFQRLLYQNTGIYLDIVRHDNVTTKAIAVTVIDSLSEGTTEEGCHFYVEDGNLVLLSEFPYKLDAKVTEFFNEYILSSTSDTVTIDEDFDLKYDVRNIYYSEFGAVGDGIADDFAALREAHDYANRFGHTVHADPGATYYIGSSNGVLSIEVTTDTYWHGCKFIFDDSEIDVNDSERATAIFHIRSSTAGKIYSENNVPITSLVKGAENVGFGPGYPALLIVYNSNKKHYIRYGANQNNGQAQQEIIMVDEHGNVDPSTPVQWTYETITKVEIIRTDDKPITVSGGTKENPALVETIFNGTPISDYTYFWRNIYISRSNVILENITHIITDDVPEADGGTGSPYQGFTCVKKCANVLIRGMTYQHPEFRHVYNQLNNRMGSYEMNASHVHNLTWTDCKQSNFYNEDGSVTFHGMMGTNYCKNITFDSVFVCSFDAHEGVYNATIRNSTCEHMNFIGDGLITIENTTVYVDGEQHAAMNLRGDYGSTWWGDVYIDGLTMKCASSMSKSTEIRLINVAWKNWDFGYKVSLPQNITMKNVKLQEYKYGIRDGERWEEIVSTNSREIRIFASGVGDYRYDLSDPNVSILLSGQNINPITPTQTITVINEDPSNPLRIKWMTCSMFKNTKVTVDGVEKQIG